MTADLLTLDDIAAMHHCSIRHARDVLVKLPGFPAEAPTSTARQAASTSRVCSHSP